jgi:hypothetical protein
MRSAIMIVVTFVGADGMPGMSRIHARNVAAGPTPLLWRKDGIFALHLRLIFAPSFKPALVWFRVK